MYLTENPKGMAVRHKIPSCRLFSSILAHSGLSEHDLTSTQLRAIARVLLRSYLGLLDQLMELCEKLCNSGISRNEGHGMDL